MAGRGAGPLKVGTDDAPPLPTPNDAGEDGEPPVKLDDAVDTLTVPDAVNNKPHRLPLRQATLALPR